MKIRYPWQKLCITVLVLLFAAGLYLSPVSCPIRSVFHVPCPGCGMTRALLFACRLNFKEAFSYHAMFWSVPILYLCFLKDGRLFSRPWANRLLYALLGCGFLGNWLLQIL